MNTDTRTVVFGQVHTPMGSFGAVITPDGLGRLTFPSEPFSQCEAWLRRWEPGARVSTEEALLADLSEQLTAYLEGSLMEFQVRLDMRGTPFQIQVWKSLLGIPYGETRSYGQIATGIGRQAAVRAVGLANGSNPIPVLVPCHRVVGSNGTLTGYGGGLPLKERLLRLEGASLRGLPAHGQGRLL